MTGLLHLIGDLADRHPVAVFRAAVALAVFGASFLVATPVWARANRRRSEERFHAAFVEPLARRRDRRARG